MGESNFAASYKGSLAAGTPACDLSLDQLDSYYRGAQPLSFLHPDVAAAAGNRLRSLAVNYARLVVDSLEERLDVEGFRLGPDGEADKTLWRWWQLNDLDEASQQLHIDAFVHGRSFAMVWPDPDDAKIPRITVESAQQMTVEIDPVTRIVTRAEKKWRVGDDEFRTVYLPDRIEKYETRAGQQEVEREDAQVNPFGVVPVVPFVNRGRIAQPLGESELTDVVPLIDAINKLATDMMVSAEHHAMPRRWATGVEVGDDDDESERSAKKTYDTWTKAAAGTVWRSDADTARFGQFVEATLDNYVQAISLFTKQIAALAGLPPHYLGAGGTDNPASADAIRSAEATLVKRALRKQRVLGGAWERVMRLAATVTKTALTDSESLETIWRSPETPSISQKVDAAQKLSTMGMPLEENLVDLGYTPTRIERIEKKRAAMPPAPAAAVPPDVPAA